MGVKRVKGLIPYGAVTLWGFYIVPLFVQNTGMGIAVLLVLFPLLVFACSVICATRHLPCFGYVVSVPVLFVPTVFIFYGSDPDVCIFYGVGYTLISLLGWGVGLLIHKNQKIMPE